MGDRYCDFAELEKAEREGTHFRRFSKRRASNIAIIAPHGGTIEPGTSEIALAIAEDDFQFYCFEGLVDAKHERFHITSTRFDEPQCLALIKPCDVVIAVHGLEGSSKKVDVGGMDIWLRDQISRKIGEAGFGSQTMSTGNHAATNRRNICNLGKMGRGVQLEITRGLRDAFLVSDPKRSWVISAACDSVGVAKHRRRIPCGPISPEPSMPAKGCGIQAI
ncbi:poly-gamma-glutamate hydrolase family protein [Mesorhizobium cantuariense]|uniref:Poly-gamma-glutamate hydrolase family protein n=1 Tax=Mesorhizobium cantuariense TaxID=1300275 RepID=A0ABV7MR23_9HYPH